MMSATPIAPIIKAMARLRHCFQEPCHAIADINSLKGFVRDDPNATDYRGRPQIEVACNV
ncbi:hypothetical protein AGR3A_Lc130411 [Agrobacterium tomkonis CFBP 6623]|uniref:Uncharacterized protein n=1 Tax=Agrobacterium tomkonis CFBP 6623 TaxID=1183432 RepID=A0A1S7RG52_9HYPH|nr:hypothetical protein AGR3A_Lc130411 [Agrobacterium tomkonis CFBP 6623]